MSGKMNENIGNGDSNVSNDLILPKIQLFATRTAYTGPAPSALSSSTDAAASAPPSSTPDDDVLHSRFQSLHRILRKGDIVWACGTPMRTKTGELSLVPKD